MEYTVALHILAAEDLFVSHWGLIALGASRIDGSFVLVMNLLGG